MRIADRSRGKSIVMLCALLAAAMMVFVSGFSVRAADSYKVSFKAGSKGNINGQSSVTEEYEYNSTLGDSLAIIEGQIVPDNGYYFTGWSKDINSGTKVTRRENYVAQYARIIDEAVYRVNYVDTYGNAVATQKVVTTGLGAVVTEAAVPVIGYSVNTQYLQATINDADGTELTFVYTQDPNVVTETEVVVTPGGTTVTVVGATDAATAGGTAAATNTVGAGTEAAQAEAQETGEGTAQVEEDEVPLAQEPQSDDSAEIEEDEVPLGEKEVSSGNVMLYGIVGIIVLVAVLIGGYIYFRGKSKMK